MSIFEQLAAPFPSEQISWRMGRMGLSHGRPWAQVFPYLDARRVRSRLNQVLGHENWQVSYATAGAGGVIATVSLRLNGEWFAKADGADYTEREPLKGGFSNAFKRACSAWGLGEYLYMLTEARATFSENGANRVRIDGATYRWDPPTLPALLHQADQPVGSGPSLSRLVRPVTSSIGSERRTLETAVDSRPITEQALTVAAAISLPVPFGPFRGLPLGDVLKTSRADVQSGRDWAVRRGKYELYVRAVDLLLAG